VVQRCFPVRLPEIGLSGAMVVGSVALVSLVLLV
jgi:hypothetical protein